MSENIALHTASLIESAMERLAHTAAGSEVSTTSSPRLEVVSAPAQPARGWARMRANLLSAAAVAASVWVGLMWLTTGDAIDGGAATPAPPAAVEPVAAPAASATSPAALVGAAAEAVAVDVGEAQARDLLERWRQAWASRDVEAYLACYSPEFKTADGQPRSAWAAARRNKLSSQSEISLRVHDVRVERIDANQLQVEFLQDYASGNYRENARPKTLRLVGKDGDWRIAGEWQRTSAVASK